MCPVKAGPPRGLPNILGEPLAKILKSEENKGETVLASETSTEASYQDSTKTNTVEKRRSLRKASFTV